MPEATPRPQPPRPPSVVEVMSPEDCLRFLESTTTVGRLAFRSSRGQQLLPVNFVFRNERVYFSTSRDSVLSELADGCDDVAFEIDYPDRLTQHAWSVLVTGSTTQVSDDEVDLAGPPPRPWAPGPRDVLVELTPDTITGRRIRNPG